MKFLDANVLCEAPAPRQSPSAEVIDWLRRHEADLAVEPLFQHQHQLRQLFDLVLVLKLDDSRLLRGVLGFKFGDALVARVGHPSRRSCSGRSCEFGQCGN